MVFCASKTAHQHAQCSNQTVHSLGQIDFEYGLELLKALPDEEQFLALAPAPELFLTHAPHHVFVTVQCYSSVMPTFQYCLTKLSRSSLQYTQQTLVRL